MQDRASAAVAASTAHGRNTTYTVRSGDTLGSIARAQLGDARRWTEIATLNRDILPNPNRLEVGMTLELPPAQPDGLGRSASRAGWRSPSMMGRTLQRERLTFVTTEDLLRQKYPPQRPPPVS